AATGSSRARLLRSDPSYVFFRIAPDQSPQQGPIGALGVPLTAGRSIAVDPRVTPMGYPVYLSSPRAAGAAQPLQRLVIAQDTGGAIRGALRADFFWGFGADAGRQALQTRQRGQMWLLLPRAEASTLFERGVATRSLAHGAGTGSRLGECLVDDATFCSEPD
ncbi:MAG TPA: 3D domain-containing protein, partial [Albitalea sp.]